MLSYWFKDKWQNFGDVLAPDVLAFATGQKVKRVEGNVPGKVLGLGSILHNLLPGDTVWGTGSNQPNAKYNGKGVTVLATRGTLSEAQIENTDLPHVYGDPALLLPLMYQPVLPKLYKIGYVPHYIDKKNWHTFGNYNPANYTVIDVCNPNWKQTLDQILACELIVSSSLHGIIVAEAYGIPAIWESYSDKIIGGDFKYQDYFLGTGRRQQIKGVVLPPIPNLRRIQANLINALDPLLK